MRYKPLVRYDPEHERSKLGNRYELPKIKKTSKMLQSLSPGNIKDSENFRTTYNEYFTIKRKKG